MDFQNYDDYMRNTLGFSGMGNQSMGCMNCNNMCAMPYQNMWQNQPCDLERMYPDSYQVVYPMVVTACRMITMPITEELIDNITDDIYDRAIADGRINIDIDVKVQSREESNDRQMANRPRRPQRRNMFFRDLIRILLLRELLGRRPGFPRF